MFSLIWQKPMLRGKIKKNLKTLHQAALTANIAQKTIFLSRSVAPTEKKLTTDRDQTKGR